MHSLIGHNGPPPTVEIDVPEQPKKFETRGDLPDDLPAMHYFKCDIKALYTTLLSMPLERRGFYMTALLAMYDRMEPLPADDRVGMLLTGTTDLRVYRRLKAELLATERCLVETQSGRVSNARFEDEITKYVAQHRNRSEGRKAIKNKPEKETPAPRVTSSHNTLARHLGRPLTQNEVNHHVEAHLSEKLNKNNEPTPSSDSQVTAKPESITPHKLLSKVRKEDSKSLTDRLPMGFTLSETGISDDVDADASKIIKRVPYSVEFEGFWKSYPETRGMSKIDAWKAWQKLSAADRHLATEALPSFRELLTDRRKRQPDATCLHAQGYLNQRRFETLAPQPAASVSAGPWWADPNRVSQVTHEQWRGSITKYANGIWPVDKLGPPPGSLRCVVPGDLVSELRLTETYTDGGIKR